MNSGWSVLLNPSVAVCFAQTGALAAIMIKTKEKKVKELATPALISSIFGVTEPAIYGITLPMKTPFIMTCIAGAIQGIYCGLTNVTGYAMGGMGIFLFPSYINPKTGSFTSVINLAICSVISLILGFALTMMTKIPTLYGEEETTETTPAEGPSVTVASETILAPVAGEVCPLSEVKDEVFSSGAMGAGLAIKPSEGLLKSPVDGTVSLVFPTGHAIGLKSKNGAEILIHIGMDTVELNGEGFLVLVSKDQEVKVGQPLVKFDLDAIKAKGYDLTTPVIITNSKSYQEIGDSKRGAVKAGDQVLTLS